MNMTCLNPAGTPPTGLIALIYQVNPNGLSLPGTPIAQVPVDLSACPTLTTWTGHAFTGADFAAIPLNFSGVTLTAGTGYGVFFAGLVPGTQPPGWTGFVPAPPTLWLGLAGIAVASLLAQWRRGQGRSPLRFLNRG